LKEFEVEVTIVELFKPNGKTEDLIKVPKKGKSIFHVFEAVIFQNWLNI